MTYQAHETSTEGGRPVELYVFTIGSSVYYYTSAEDEVTIAAQVYIPRPGLQREAFVDGPEERNTDFEVTLPTSDPVSQFFTQAMPGLRIGLVVYRYHRGDTPTPETHQVFDGYVHSAAPQKNMKEMRIVARPAIATSGTQIPPRTCQGSCNFVLYGPKCGVDDTNPAFRASARTATGQVGNVLTVAGLGAYAPGWFTGGYVEAIDTADFRLVLDDDGAGNLTLIVPFATAPTTVNVLAGCDHTAEGAHGCGPKFDNGDRFGGFPYVPKKNPFESGVV